MPSSDEGHIRVGTQIQVRVRNRVVKTEDGNTIAVFHQSGKYYAVDNWCPHSGYPLVQGKLAEGVLTCFFHQAKFDITNGDSLDEYAMDICAYPVILSGDEIWVDPTPISRD